MLRSIHFGLPSTLGVVDLLSQPTPTNITALTIYRRIICRSRISAPKADNDGALLGLVALLADIHTLAIVFHPLGTMSFVTGKEPLPKGLTDSLSFSSPYLPFSPPNENRLVRRRLENALDLWAESYLSPSTRDTAVLFYFAKMYLILPDMQILPALAGYPPRVLSDGSPSQEQQNKLDGELQAHPEVQKYAWFILEHVEQSAALAPMWLPIAIFFAGLVVWRTVFLQMKSGGHGSRKVVLLFKDELLRMRWPCCKPMATTLESLLS